MSVAELKRFAEAVKADSGLQGELKGIGADLDAVASFAGGKGYDFTGAELKAHASEKKGELSEEQLDKAVVGVDTTVVVVAVTVVLT